MPEHSPVSILGLVRDQIDTQAEYAVQVRDFEAWARPIDVEHRQLTGLDVWHVVRRAHAAVARIGPHGVITLATPAAVLRFIPIGVYAALFCSADDCENAADGEGWDGLCGSCADRVCAAEHHPKETTTAAKPGAITNQERLRKSILTCNVACAAGVRPATSPSQEENTEHE
ncbi:hypothetical protein OG689_41610 [Kitasatospora sp. NBC_00240]|uniref:hypothetical protein n=1 Tax=Kitasatospora sp. NBC_00240 TaxID=2903567 RepID=UPI00224D0CD3|nr:hypothetical protein [Kitasatospora sp. NBC_00240]MCX5215655.1 hypothetical protein [Kitasatospora sp. NBC_00240]